MHIFKQLFSIFLSFCLVYSQVLINLAYAEGIETDGTTQTTLDKARNGVSVVNIAKPSSRGLSHNSFKKYNVSKRGLILNNSGSTCVKTQLAGYIYGNKHLSTGSAKVILNEVTSASRSYLNGLTEVAGRSADLVLVNPNGISMNGAGFINIPTITFSTGQANIAGGQINSFSVNQGDISIEGEGLNTKTQQATYIYAKSLKLNAKIHAQNLNVALGSNKIDYTSRQATAKVPTDSAKQNAVMLDSSALGGMYANRITLVGTDKGVGVNLPPEVLASTGDITITADGKIQLNDLAAETDIIITSTNSDIALQGTSHSGNATSLNAKTDIVTHADTTIVSEKKINLNSGNAFTNRGTVMAGIDSDGTANYSGTIELYTTELINKNKIATGSLNAETITNTNAEITAQAIHSTTLNNSQGSINGGESIAITTNHLNNTAGTIEANKNLSIASQTIDLDNSSLYANDTLNLTLKVLNNVASSQIQSNGDLNIDATDTITNHADLLANGNVTLKTKGVITNSQLISAQQTLDIQAESLTNEGSEAKIAGGSGNSVITTTGDLTNSSRISSQDKLTINSSHLFNHGSIATGMSLTAHTTTLDNYQTLFGAGVMNLYTSNQLVNHTDATIFSLGDMTLAADESGNKTAHVKNETATIETYNGNLTIHSDLLENTTDAPIISSHTAPTSYVKVSHGHKNSYDDVFTTITTQYFSEKNDPGEIISGKSLTINSDTIKNHYSLIAANENIDITTASLTNKSATTKTITNTRTEKYRNENYEEKVCGWLGCWYEWKMRKVHKGTIYDTNQKVNNSVSATIQASGSISIKGGGTLTNGVTNKPLSTRTRLASDTDAEQAQPKAIDIPVDTIQLPTGQHGLFVVSKDPASTFLVETNPEFAIYSNFISSDYMMDKLGIDPASTTKRLGDAFYENKLIRESVFRQTGKRFLDTTIKNDFDQYKYLMDNAMQASGDLNLSVGIALSQEQINRLTSDIVWMEERIIQGHRILVPVVYIASTDTIELVDGSKIIAGETVTLQVTTLVNSGTVKAGDSLNVDASDAITNVEGRLLAEKEMSLHATNNIRNTSGSLIAENISITSAKGGFIHETYANAVSSHSDDVIDDKTEIGNTGKIVAEGSLKIDVATSARFKGSTVNASDMSIKAEDVHIGTIQDERHFHSEKGENGEFITESSTTHIASLIDVGNLDIHSNGTTTIKGSKIQASDTIKIEAKQLDIVSVKDSNHKASNSKSGGDFSSSEKSKTEFTSTSKAASLSAANMELTTTVGDITVAGSNVSATGNLTLDSARDITITAGYDGSFKEEKTKEGGFFENHRFYSETESLDGKMTKTAVASTISAGTMSLKSKHDLLIEGSNLSGDTITAEARNITVKAAENEEKTWSQRTEKTIGFGDLKDTLLQPHKAGKLKDKKLTLKIADAAYEESDNSTKKTTVTSANLNGRNVTLTADSEEAFAGNILVEGSNITAEESISLTASNDVVVKEAKETTETKTASKKGTAELTANAKHQAVEVIKAAEALQQAIKASQDAKDAYDDYKDQKKEAERHYKEGLIEKEDLDDIRDDERFYLASVTLTAAAVVSATKNLTTQAIAATQSSGTYGFNADIQLDIDAIVEKAKEISTRSVGSNLAAATITINAGKRALVQGSNLNADQQISIEANEVEISASRDTSESSSSTDHAHFTHTWSAYGGPTSNVSADFSQSDNRSATYNNSRLNGKTISITSKADTIVTGAVVKARDTLDLDVGGDLTVASLQDRSRSKSASVGASGGSGSASTNASLSKGKKKWVTEQTTLDGGIVTITVNGHTDLKGAKIAAVDENGNDTGNLTLKTKTFSYEDIRDRDANSNMAISGGTGGFGSAGLGFSDATQISKATVGQGTIRLGEETDPELTGLNRDVSHATVGIKNTGVQLNMDAATLDVIVNPVTTVNTIKDDSKQIGALASKTKEMVAINLDNEGGVKSTADAIALGFLMINDPAAAARTNNKLAQSLKKLNNIAGLTPEQVKDVYNEVFSGFLKNGMIMKPGDKPGTMELVSTEGLETKELQEHYKNFLAATDEKDLKSYAFIDPDKNNISSISDALKITGAETVRQHFARDNQTYTEDGNRNKKLEEAIERAAAEGAVEAWNMFGEDNAADQSKVVNWYNENKNSETIQSGNAALQHASHEDVMPLCSIAGICDTLGETVRFEQEMNRSYALKAGNDAEAVVNEIKETSGNVINGIKDAWEEDRVLSTAQDKLSEFGSSVKDNAVALYAYLESGQLSEVMEEQVSGDWQYMEERTRNRDNRIYEPEEAAKMLAAANYETLKELVALYGGTASAKVLTKVNALMKAKKATETIEKVTPELLNANVKVTKNLVEKAKLPKADTSLTSKQTGGIQRNSLRNVEFRSKQQPETDKIYRTISPDDPHYSQFQSIGDTGNIKPKGGHNDLYLHVQEGDTNSVFTSWSYKKEANWELWSKEGCIQLELDTTKMSNGALDVSKWSWFPEEYEISVIGDITNAKRVR